jgi:hypothetical protein
LILGDVHFYGYSRDSWDSRAYPIVRFLSETGIQSLPSIDTWLEATDNQSDFDMTSDLVRHREHSHGQLDSMMYVHRIVHCYWIVSCVHVFSTHIQMNLPLPVTNDQSRNFTQWIYLSQINQAMTLKSMSDHCRLHSSVDMINKNTSQG